MKKDYFSNEISYSSLFMWKMDTMHLEAKNTFQEEFIKKIKDINPQINKNKLYIINAMVFEELVTKKSISNFLKKDPGNISRSVDKLVSLKVIQKSLVDIEGKSIKVLSLNKKFYSQYIKMINEYFERVYTKNFIPTLEEICKQIQNQKLDNVTKTLKKIKR